MALIATLLDVASQEPTRVGEILSGVFGSVSLTAWLCVSLPQLLENYKKQSADGLSMKFLLLWLFGDLTNLGGALCTNLAPSAIVLACYFCLADVVLISQCAYYNSLNTAKRARAAQRSDHGGRNENGNDNDSDTTAVAPEEDDALIANRHQTARRRTGANNLDPLARIFAGEGKRTNRGPWYNQAVVLAVITIGLGGYFAAYRIGAIHKGSNEPAKPTVSGLVATLGLLLGYGSAACYLCARVPQIIKNHRKKSTEGLAILFFLLSLTGNLTYGASLLSYAKDPSDMVTAAPWLLGSLGTIVEDLIIFGQFQTYSKLKVSKTNSVAV